MAEYIEREALDKLIESRKVRGDCRFCAKYERCIANGINRKGSQLSSNRNKTKKEVVLMEYSELKKRHFGTNDTDKKLTDKDIIKALECCSTLCCECDECPLYCVGVNCSSFELHRYALDLINRQKSEIDSAKAKIEICAEVIERQDAEIERLKECPKCVYKYDGKVTEYCIQSPCPNFKTVEQIKTESFKEFVKRLKENTITKSEFD